LLPIRPDSPLPPLAVGDTRLYLAPQLAAKPGLEALWVRDDGRQPTASFKDRASALAMVKAGENRADIVATAGTGNGAVAALAENAHPFDDQMIRINHPKGLFVLT